MARAIQDQKRKYYIGTGDFCDPETNSSTIFHVIFCTRRKPDKVYDKVLRDYYSGGDVSIKDRNGHWVANDGCVVVNRSFKKIMKTTYDELKGIIYTVSGDDNDFPKINLSGGS